MKEIKTLNFGIIEKNNFIGVGTYANVYLFLDKSGQKYCVKKSKLKFEKFGFFGQYLREIIYHYKTDGCYNIAKLYEVYFENNTKIYYIMEYLDFNLNDFMKKNNDICIKFLPKFIEQIGNALIFLHSKEINIIHRDVKPENILLNISSSLNNDNILFKLTDFNLSKDYIDASYTPNMCTMWYRAPEIFLGKKYDKKVDIWSFGMCILSIVNKTEIIRDRDAKIYWNSLLTYFKMFDSKSPQKFTKIKSILLRLDNDSLRENIEKILIFCLQFESEKRPSIKKIFNFMNFNCINDYIYPNNNENFIIIPNKKIVEILIKIKDILFDKLNFEIKKYAFFNTLEIFSSHFSHFNEKYTFLNIITILIISIKYFQSNVFSINKLLDYFPENNLFSCDIFENEIKILNDKKFNIIRFTLFSFILKKEKKNDNFIYDFLIKYYFDFKYPFLMKSYFDFYQHIFLQSNHNNDSIAL